MVSMDDLLREDVQQRLAAIWRDPQSLNPTRRSAEVTRDIAARLAKIAKRLEKRYAPVDIAEFLMRCLFTMFAEDVGGKSEAERLIPNKGFERLLHQMIETPEHFAPALESLWRVMDSGGYAACADLDVARVSVADYRAEPARPTRRRAPPASALQRARPASRRPTESVRRLAVAAQLARTCLDRESRW